MIKQNQTIKLRRFSIATAVERMVKLKGDEKNILLQAIEENCSIGFSHKSNGVLTIKFDRDQLLSEQKFLDVLSETGLQQKYNLKYTEKELLITISDSNYYHADEISYAVFRRFFDLPEETPLKLIKTHNDYDCRPVIVQALSTIKEKNARGIELLYPAEMIKIRIWQEEQSLLMELPLIQLNQQQKEKAWIWFSTKGWSCYDHDSGFFLQAQETDKNNVNVLQFRFLIDYDYVAMYVLSLFMEIFDATIETYLHIRYMTWYEPFRP